MKKAKNGNISRFSNSVKCWLSGGYGGLAVTDHHPLEEGLRLVCQAFTRQAYIVSQTIIH